MAEIGYDAETADIKYSFDADSHGFEIQISGLNDKLPVIFEKILNQISNFNPPESVFESLKNHFSNHSTTNLKMPENVSHYVVLLRKLIA